MPAPILWYIADPMCSWCWGFAPTIDAIKTIYGERLKVALVLGGLRPGTREAVTPALREEILHHWQQVHERTGQPFAFAGALPDGFIYDTEPASRAVVAIAEIAAQQTFPMFKAIQNAFYVEQKDVTQPAVLADLAKQQGVAADLFLQVFHSPAATQMTLGHFQKARHWGVRGFPTLIVQTDSAYVLLTTGWRPLEELGPQIERCLPSVAA